MLDAVILSLEVGFGCFYWADCRGHVWGWPIRSLKSKAIISEKKLLVQGEMRSSSARAGAFPCQLGVYPETPEPEQNVDVNYIQVVSACEVDE